MQFPRMAIWRLLLVFSLLLQGCGTTAPPPGNGGHSSAQDQTVTVHATRTGTKYHMEGCRFLSKSDIPITLSDAKAKGLTPCSVCNPPQ